MKRWVGAATVAAVALAMLVGGAVLLPDETREEGGSAGLVTVTHGSALLSPAVPSGSLEGSIAALQERLRSNPEDRRGYASLGLAYVAQARVTADPSWYPLAEGALERSLRLGADDNLDALLGLGVLALARHDFERALRFGRDAERIAPSDADAHGVIGDALLELGRYDEAFDAFQTMVDLRPSLASYARVSYARELLGDVPGAVEAMALAFETAGHPADAAWAAHQLGQLELGRGRVGAAARWFERGLQVDPSFAPNLAGLGTVAWARGQVALAIRRYREVVERYPSVEHVAALGDLYAVTGRPDLAEEQYAVVEALRTLASSNGVNVDLEIALFDADHGEPASALAAAEAAWRRRESVHVADAYAWALYASGRYEEAARLAGRALRLGTANANFLFHAGMIERALGHDDAARRLLRRALATNPNFSILHADTAADALAELDDLEAER